MTCNLLRDGKDIFVLTTYPKTLQYIMIDARYTNPK